MGDMWNLSDGASADRIGAHCSGPTRCRECRHLTDGCRDHGICGLKFEEAFDARQAKEPMAAWESAKWAAEWATDNYVDGQELTCERFEPWQRRS